ncbi:tetratricopeptide repeat protein [Aridibaculum aurantiacum]|uniref:tetratricopeptide repeat protein n=1 Tax=Aridibaculum aurantiacum TaxID=2810307 RepID=UPI001A95C6FF|nr:tetratricopeptide repeat protein [Aridibaculum aurantiacum]
MYILKMAIAIVAVTVNCTIALSQRSETDSIRQLLKHEKNDSNRAILLYNLAALYQGSKPDSTLILAQDALILSRRIDFKQGEAQSLNQMANAFNWVGNYPKALELYIQSLKIVEQGNNPTSHAIALINIATVYLFQHEYRKALDYTFLADSILVENNLINHRKYTLLNLGDIYEKFNKLDSAMDFSNRAYAAAKSAGDDNLVGTALTNQANVCLKLETFDLALKNYRRAIPFLKETGDDDMLSENYLGLAKTFLALQAEDSARHYAQLSFAISNAAGFQRRLLETSTFLVNYYDSKQKIDSAYKYQQHLMAVKDSLHSIEKIKEGYLLTLSEQQRQKEIQELIIKEKYEWKQRLQYIGIGVLIPLLFIFTLYLRNKKVKPRYIEYLGLVSLLMFFEYITLLLHPVVVNLTNHVPLFELIVFSIIATLLTRSHHRVEHWFLARIGGKNHHAKTN